MSSTHWNRTDKIQIQNRRLFRHLSRSVGSSESLTPSALLDVIGRTNPAAARRGCDVSVT
jgi:hypothetical protein